MRAEVPDQAGYLVDAPLPSEPPEDLFPPDGRLWWGEPSDRCDPLGGDFLSPLRETARPHVLDTAAVGADLALMIEHFVPATLSDDALVSYVAALRRLTS